ncbi:MAG TPA: S-methyl-5'-thioadenosine phosphorylase [Polyangiaceae bacterium]|jgi:5'-methylthioadenosine phosphorylase|nr:S-methyl-5'-thioadenosine phosphorylase [Polyangiaceae bacterium]
MKERYVLGVLGGSGVYDIEGLEEVERLRVDTPYGMPSDEIVKARLAGRSESLLFLPRHGRGHRIPPHAINYRANICALKKLGATHVVSISATGSMREEIVPGDLVVVDQFIDLTKRRISTFFDAGAAAHVAFADPICPRMADALFGAAESVVSRTGGAERRPTVHRGGTYVCMEGPQFSTRAESRVYRSWGVHLIGMTNMPEAKLAREAELPYATLALATDYDCWHETEEAVDVAAVIRRLGGMVAYAKAIVRELAERLPDPASSPATGALQGAVMTPPEHMSPETRESLRWLLPQL